MYNFVIVFMFVMCSILHPALYAVLSLTKSSIKYLKLWTIELELIYNENPT